MYLTYTSSGALNRKPVKYRHEKDEVAITILRAATFNRMTRVLWLRERWELEGRLIGCQVPAPGDVSILTKIKKLEEAYENDFGDLELFYDDGTRAHALINSKTVNGTHVIEPVHFPTGYDAELATYRNYRVVVEGVVPFHQGLVGIGMKTTGTRSKIPIIVNWSESLNITGTGDAREVWLECRNALPVHQTVSVATPISSMQSGSAESFIDFLPVVPPIFPTIEMKPYRSITRDITQDLESGINRYRIAWSYQFLTGRTSDIAASRFGQNRPASYVTPKPTNNPFDR